MRRSASESYLGELWLADRGDKERAYVAIPTLSLGSVIAADADRDSPPRLSVATSAEIVS